MNSLYYIPMYVEYEIYLKDEDRSPSAAIPILLSWLLVSLRASLLQLQWNIHSTLPQWRGAWTSLPANNNEIQDDVHCSSFICNWYFVTIIVFNYFEKNVIHIVQFEFSFQGDTFKWILDFLIKKYVPCSIFMHF